MNGGFDAKNSAVEGSFFEIVSAENPAGTYFWMPDPEVVAYALVVVGGIKINEIKLTVLEACCGVDG